MGMSGPKVYPQVTTRPLFPADDFRWVDID
jgi:hypothetical protein